MFYLYVYLNPLKPGNFIYEDLSFEYEPFYVGKGKNNRYLSHLFSYDKELKKTTAKTRRFNNLKNNKIKKILLKTNITDFANNYIIFPFSNLDENFILQKEKEYIEKIGTISDIVNVIKRGPLTNLMRGGMANPIMCGKNNPMYNKTIFDVWKQKGENVDDKIKDWKNSLKKGHLHWTSRLSEDKLNDFKEKCRNNTKEYIKNLSDEQKQVLIKKRVITFKETLKNRDPEISKEIFKKTGLTIKSYYENMSVEEKNKWKNNVSKSLKNRYKNISDDERKKLSERSKKTIKKIKSDEELYNKWISLRSGDNYYLNKQNKTLKQYLIDKYGEQYTEEYFNNIKQKTSGKNNPMYQKGYKINGSKNGRALNIIVHFPDGKKYLCKGTFKKLCREVLSTYKPQPHRKYKFEKEENGWYFSKIEDINKIKITDYIIYE